METRDVEKREQIIQNEKKCQLDIGRLDIT